jgi:hypothetical protein
VAARRGDHQRPALIGGRRGVVEGEIAEPLPPGPTRWPAAPAAGRGRRPARRPSGGRRPRCRRPGARPPPRRPGRSRRRRKPVPAGSWWPSMRSAGRRRSPRWRR